jgi:hypothetical protein
VSPDYRPSSVSDPGDYAEVREWERTRSGGSHTVNQGYNPGLSGPTFTGVPHLKDVP